MKHTGMPASRPTADCIWNSFRSSRKKHLILTGGRQTGKTTLLGKLFPMPIPGITTWAKPMEGVYLMDNLTKETVRVGIFDEMLPGHENKMKPIRSGFAEQGVRFLKDFGKASGDWVVIDEIGYLETDSEAYCDALLNLMEQKRVCAVVRKQELPFLQMLCRREDAFLVDMDAPLGNLGCVIMASGVGKRFGGNKVMADFRGKPLVQWTMEATEGLFSQRVVVTRHREVQQLCSKLGVPVVLHDLPNRSDTVRLGLEALDGPLDGCMFCPGDQPLLTWETVASLCLCAKNDGSSIWRTAHDKIPGSPVIFPQSFFRELSDLPEGMGGSTVVRKFPEAVRLLSVADPLELADVDTREQLAKLEALK